MVDKTYLVQHKTTEASSQIVVASTFEVHGEHLVFLTSEGKLAALFSMDVVKSWNVIDDGSRSSQSSGA